MNRKFRDITGMRFGKLIVLKRGDNDKSGHTRWICQYDCGSSPKLIYTDALINNKTTSCGCYNKHIVANIGHLNKRQNNYDLSGQYGIGYMNNGAYDIDHINRKSQLRIVTHSQNLQNRIIPQNNTSGHIGVSWDKHRNKWVAYINVNQKRIRLGGFCDISDAIIARKNAEKQYFGEYRNSEDD